MLGIGVWTGYFREVLYVFFIVFIHEMGHVVAAHFFDWQIQKIELLPFGGVVEMNETSNRPLKEELVVILAGPLQHVWLIVLSYLLLPTPLWTINDHDIFLWHNLVILLFNLLPIWPLDGGRLVHLGCHYLWPYKLAYQRSVIVSLAMLVMVTIASLLIYPFHFNLWVVILFLYISNYLQWKQRHYSLVRFLLDRNKRDFSKLKTRTIRCHPETSVQHVLQRLKRDYYYTIAISPDKRIGEEVIIEKFFERNRLDEPIRHFFNSRD